MGLPLFIAPVGSDLPPQSSGKNGSTSPRRSAISRDRLRRRYHSRRLAERSMDGLRALATPPLVSLNRPSPRQDHPTSSSERLDDQMYHYMYNIFRADDTGSDNPLNETAAGEAAQRWWTEVGSQTRPRRPRMNTPRDTTQEGNVTRGPDAIPSRFDRSPDRTRANTLSPASRDRRRPGTLSRGDVDPLDTESSNLPTGFYSTSSLDHDPELLAASDQLRGLLDADRRVRRLHSQHARGVLRLRSQPSRLTRQSQDGMDGLGDRDRSLSPEGWDTLLTTLTPDPQPPSVGSSFASVNASAATSQNTAHSSATSMSGPAAAGVHAADQPCDSGREDSDDGETTFERSAAAPRHLNASQGRQVRLQVPERIGRGSSRPRSRRLEDLRSDATARRYLTDAEIFGDENTLPPILGAPETHRPGRAGSPGHWPFRRDRWVGQLSVGADDDQANAVRRPDRDFSHRTPNRRSNSEEDWLGMQRIVRNLARREDVPDEWWAEAGLSRTLPNEDEEVG